MLLGASACAKQALPLYPPPADVEALTTAKPAPPVEIVTDAEIAALYSAEVETWGETLQAAGLRVCRWMVEQGADYECGG